MEHVRLFFPLTPASEPSLVEATGDIMLLKADVGCVVVLSGVGLTFSIRESI